MKNSLSLEHLMLNDEVIIYMLFSQGYKPFYGGVVINIEEGILFVEALPCYAEPRDKHLIEYFIFSLDSGKNITNKNLDIYLKVDKKII